MLLIHFVEGPDAEPRCREPEREWLWSCDPADVTCPACRVPLAAAAGEPEAESRRAASLRVAR